MITAASLYARLEEEALGLTPYTLLLNIECSPECVSALARLLKTSWPNTSQLVRRLEGRGLVERIRGATLEYKKVNVCITQAGLDLLRRVERE